MYNKSVEWKTGDGRTARVAVRVSELIGSRHPGGTAGLYVDAYIDDQPVGQTIIEIDHPVAVARIGKLGIKSEQYEQIKRLISEAESDSDLVKYEERYAAAEKRRADYEAAHDRIVRAMRAGE